MSNRCPNCWNTELEIIDYLIPTEGDVYFCKVCANNGKPAKWTSLAVYLAGLQYDGEKENNKGDK